MEYVHQLRIIFLILLLFSILQPGHCRAIVVDRCCGKDGRVTSSRNYYYTAQPHLHSRDTKSPEPQRPSFTKGEISGTIIGTITGAATIWIVMQKCGLWGMMVQKIKATEKTTTSSDNNNSDSDGNALHPSSTPHHHNTGIMLPPLSSPLPASPPPVVIHNNHYYTIHPAAQMARPLRSATNRMIDTSVEEPEPAALNHRNRSFTWPHPGGGM